MIQLIRDTKDNFYKLLKVGEEGEEKVINILEARGHKLIERSTGYAPDYDAVMMHPTGQEYTIEIKRDSSTLSNVAVEYFSRGKPSGIDSTKAVYFAVYFDAENAFYIANCDRLREWIEQHNPRKVRNGTNDSGTWCYLIPKRLFIEEFQRIEA